MGCVASSIEKEERVRICKERKILMKQLLSLRGEFADAQLMYLRALKNTGVTLRQLTETESLELEYAPTSSIPLPPSPPPPLPPSPPPPPTFSPDFRDSETSPKGENQPEETIEVYEEDTSVMPPPPPALSSSWDFWDPFAASSPRNEKKTETPELLEEENWADTNTEFEEEGVENGALILLPEKPLVVDFGDDNSSMVSWQTREAADLAMVVWRSKKNLAGIMKDLDDYFLKASAVSTNIVIMVDVNSSDSFHGHNLEEKNRKKYNSAKVFNALAWSWSSKSLQSIRTATESCGPNEPCRPGAHCITLEKLYTEVQKLYKDVKDEEFTRLELEKKSLLLQKQRDEDHDWTKTEKTRLSVEALQSDITRLQESITVSSSSVSQLIDEELHPQLIAIISGLMSMWRTMYECHQVQNHISQQTSHLTNQQSVDPTTNYHHHAAAQLKTEVTSWYNSFCRLVRFQREYVRSLCNWIQLTDCCSEGSHWSVSSSAVHNLCKEWQLALEKLPDKVVSEAIKSFLAAVNSILLQQEEELDLQKKSIKLEKKLQRQSQALAEMEMKHESSNLSVVEGSNGVLSPKHPLSIKRAQVEALKKRAHDGKEKYLNSVQVTQAMTLNNLGTTLPNVFQGLMGYSSAYAKSLEVILGGDAKQMNCDQSSNQMC